MEKMQNLTKDADTMQMSREQTKSAGFTGLDFFDLERQSIDLHEICQMMVDTRNQLEANHYLSEEVQDFLLFLLPARSNTTDFRSVQSFHCDVANEALDSPRRRCGKISEGCTSLFDHIACHAVKALTMSHDGALPFIKLRVLLNERTDCE